MPDLAALFARRAEVQRELAGLDEAIAGAVTGLLVEPARPADQVLTLTEAADLLGEPVETFRRRPEYLKASIRRPGERKHRYSRVALERVVRDRLAENGGG